MNLHCTTTEFNAGIDLHTKNMYVCVMDREGKIHIHREIGSFRESVGVFSGYGWHRVADNRVSLVAV